MQFVTNGPDIPDAVLQAHEDGRVVFFCGAGISYPAGLPGFTHPSVIKTTFPRELHMTIPHSIRLAARQAVGSEPWDSVRVASHGGVCCVLCGGRRPPAG